MTDTIIPAIDGGRRARQILTEIRNGTAHPDAIWKAATELEDYLAVRAYLREIQKAVEAFYDVK